MKLVLFDCDGTLVDSQHIICAAMQQAYAEVGLPAPPRARVLSIVGLSLPEAFRRLAGEENHPVDRLVHHYKQAFFALRQAAVHEEPLYPGARAVLEALARREDLVLGMATGKSRRGVKAVLDRHGLADLFATVKTADDAPSKPHPGMVLAAMEDVGAAPEDTVVIGDTAYDMAMARAACVSAIGVAWGYHPAPLLVEAGAQDVIAEFAALLPALERIWPPSNTGVLAAAESEVS